MIRETFQRLAIMGACIVMIVLLAFVLPRHLWRQNWAAAVEQAKLYYDQADRIIATNRGDFARGTGEAGGEEFYAVDYSSRAVNYLNGPLFFGSEEESSDEEKPSADQKFQVRTAPPCWTNMLKLANSMHYPRRFNANFWKADALPTLFIGNLETASGQSRFVVVELGHIRVKKFLEPDAPEKQFGEVRMSFNVSVMQLNHETCEFVGLDGLSCEVPGEFDKDIAMTVELTSLKRNAGQRFPRFRLNFGPTATTFEIQLTDYDPASPPSILSPGSSLLSDIVIGIVQIADE